MMNRFDGVSGPPEAFITGASRGIGAETARALGRRGWSVALGYREKEKRANKVADEINDMGGIEGAVAEIFQGDITNSIERANLVENVVEWSGSVDTVILNAAGGLEPGANNDYAMTVNNDAQVALAKKFLPHVSPNGAIIYVTSHWAHLYGQVELPPFDYKPIASSKNAGEESLRRMMPELSEREVRLIIVTGGLVTGTFVGDLGTRRYEDFTSQQQEIGNVVTVEDMGERIAAVAANADLPTGHTEVVGAPLDSLLEISGLEVQ